MYRAAGSTYAPLIFTSADDAPGPNRLRNNRNAPCSSPPLGANNPSRNNIDPNRLGLIDDGPAEAFERQAGKPEFGLLDLGNLVDVLEAHCPDRLLARVTCPSPLVLLSRCNIGCVE